MNPADITVDQAIAALEKAVQIKGADYVYPEQNCVYKNPENGQPSCIVGYALDNLGLLGAVSPYEGSAKSVCINLGFSSEIKDVFTAAQMAQDGDFSDDVPRKTWGEALDLARQAAKDLGRTS